jgi:hypothetical protein
MSNDDLSLLEIIWNCLPPVAIVNIIKRSNKRVGKDIHLTTVGWQRDESYTEVEGETPSGEREYTKIIGKVKR